MGRGATRAEDDEFDESMGYSGGGGGRVGGGDAGMEQTLGYGKFQPVQHGQGGGYGRDDQDMMLMDFSMGQTAMHSQVRTGFLSLVMPRERPSPHACNMSAAVPHTRTYQTEAWVNHPPWDGNTPPGFSCQGEALTKSSGERTPCGVPVRAVGVVASSNVSIRYLLASEEPDGVPLGVRGAVGLKQENMRVPDANGR
jgi:hypothetical protein